MVRQKQIDLVTSYVLDFENSKNRSEQKRMAIARFMNDFASIYVSNKDEEEIAKTAAFIMQTGVKEKDAFHVSCAIMAECDYFITTDDRLFIIHTQGVRRSFKPFSFPRAMYPQGA